MAIKDLEFVDDFELIDENEESTEQENPSSQTEEEQSQEEENEQIENDVDEEQEEESTETEGESEEEFNALKENFNFLKEQGLLVLPEGYEYDGTEEKFQSVIEESKAQMYNLVANEIYDKLPEEIRNVVKYVLEGGNDPNSYVNYSNDPFKDISMDDEDDRKEILKTYWKEKGLNDAKVNKIVSKSFDLGTDEEDAVEALEELKEIWNTKRTQLEAQAKIQKQAEEQAEKEAVAKLYKTLNEAKEIAGVEITDTDRKSFKEFTQNRYKKPDGRIVTKFDDKLEEHLTDPEKFILLTKFLQNGYNVKTKTNKTEKEVKRSFYDKIKNNSNRSDGKSKVRSGQQGSRGKSSITEGTIEFEFD